MQDARTQAHRLQEEVTSLEGELQVTERLKAEVNNQLKSAVQEESQLKEKLQDAEKKLQVSWC